MNSSLGCSMFVAEHHSCGFLRKIVESDFFVRTHLDVGPRDSLGMTFCRSDHLRCSRVTFNTEGNQNARRGNCRVWVILPRI